MSASDEHTGASAPGFGYPPGYGPPAGHQPPPGYASPSGYAPPPGYHGYGYPPAGPRPTNTMAILSLVLAFVCAPAGIVLGIIARKQIRRTGEDGSGLALVGIIVGSIATAFFALMIIVYVVVVAAAVNGSFGP